MEATVDRFGRVVIPKRVRDDLGIHPGTVLIVEERGNAVTLTPLSGPEPLAEEGGVLVFQGPAAGDLTAAVDEARKSRAADVWVAPVR